MEAVRVRSLLGYLFPYVRHLEAELTTARAERAAILDRLIRVTTGWGLEQSMPDMITSQREADEVAAKQRGPRTVFDLSRELESITLKEAEENYRRIEQAKEVNGNDNGIRNSAG